MILDHPYVCQRIPRQILEAIYGIILPRPVEGEDPDRPPTVHELLAAHGCKDPELTHSGIIQIWQLSYTVEPSFMTIPELRPRIDQPKVTHH